MLFFSLPASPILNLKAQMWMFLKCSHFEGGRNSDGRLLQMWNLFSQNCIKDPTPQHCMI